MTLAAIVRALGGDLYDGGRRANVPAPRHSAADRSVSLLLQGDRGPDGERSARILAALALGLAVAGEQRASSRRNIRARRR